MNNTGITLVDVRNEAMDAIRKLKEGTMDVSTAKEDIEKAKQYLDNEGYGTGSNFTLNAVANLMAEYAAKNCVIPAVSKALKCECKHSDSCRYETVILETKELCRHKE